MKKSFSSLNLLHEKLNYNSGSAKKSFWGQIFANYRYIKITLDYYSYIRGKVFTEDLKDNYGEEVPYTFDLAFLLYMLYRDFLTQVKKGGIKNQEVAAYLKEGKEKHFYFKKKERRVMHALTKHILEFKTIEDIEEGIAPPEERTAEITLRMREKEILRCEVLLFDLQPFLSDFEITVEDIFVIVYKDFISSITTEGNSLKLQKSILAHLHDSE